MGQVPRIAELRETVTGIKNELVEQTSQAFNQVGQLANSTADPEGFQRDADKPGQFRSLQEACLVVDALGGQARQQQVMDGVIVLPSQKCSPCAPSDSLVERRTVIAKRLHAHLSSVECWCYRSDGSRRLGLWELTAGVVAQPKLKRLRWHRGLWGAYQNIFRTVRIPQRDTLLW